MPTSTTEIKRHKKGSTEDFIQQSFKDHSTRMSELYRQWAILLAWVNGSQYVDYDSTQKKWKQNEKDPWRARISSNFMLPLVRHTVSRLISNRPIWDVIPVTPDEEDIQISNTSTKVLKDIWVRLDMDIRTIQTLFWQATCGNAFQRVGWDPEEGDEVSIAVENVEENLLRTFIEMTGLEFDVEEITTPKGEVYIDVIPPFNIASDPLVSLFDDSTWVIETQIRSIEWIVERFGNKWKDKLTETSAKEAFIYPYAFNETRIPLKGVLTHELFIKKTKKHPNGLYCFMAGEETIDKPKDNPFEHGQLPYAHFLEIPNPASMWGTCSSEQMRPLQASYNRVASNVLDHIGQVSKVQWLNPSQSGVSTITNRPGEVIRYKYPLKPEQVAPKSIPAYVERYLMRTREDMKDVTSYHNVSQGSNEPGVRSAKATHALQDADDSVLGPTLLWFNKQVAKIGRLVLQTIVQYSTDERTVSIIGDFNEQEVFTFNRDALVGKNEGSYFEVRVKTTSQQAMSRMAREQQMVQLLELGVLDPQKDKNLILGIIGLGDSITLFDQNASARTRQWNEIRQIIAGQDIKPLFLENHRIHMDVIIKFVADSKRDKLEPEVLSKILEHHSQHQELMVLEVAKQQALVQRYMGAPDAGRAESAGNQRGTQTRTGTGNQRGTQTRTGARST